MLKKTLILITILGIILCSYLFDPVLGLTEIQQKTIALLIIAMTLWATRIIPTGITSLGVIGMQILLGTATSFDESVQGFLFTPIYFILSVSLLNNVLMKIQLDKKIAQFFLYKTNGNINKVAGRFFFASMFLPIIIPSGNARLQMFIPFMEEINKEYGLSKKSFFVRFTTWSLGGINQLATLIVFTGGGFAVLSFQLLSDLGYKLSWITWLLLMAPPIWCTCLILGLIMYIMYLRNIPNSPISIEENQVAADKADIITDENKYRFVFVCCTLILLILLWIIGPWINLPTIVPIMLALIAFSLPGIGLLDNKDLRKYDWENFLLIGSALSLAVSIERNGTARWMSDLIFSIFDQTQSVFVNLVIVMFIILFIRVLFVSPTSALTVIYPLILTIATTLELNELFVFLITVLLIGCFMILPMSSPIMILTHETGYIKMKEHILLSICALVLIFALSLVCYFIYWPLII